MTVKNENYYLKGIEHSTAYIKYTICCPIYRQIVESKKYIPVIYTYLFVSTLFLFIAVERSGKLRAR